VCQGKFGTPPPHPPTPYGPINARSDPAALVEDGFKSVRGYLTEGRYLTFEVNGFALATLGSSITATRATTTHSDIHQRWVVHATGGTAVDGGEGAGKFVISSAVDGRYITGNLSLNTAKASAETYTIEDMGNGQGYSFMAGNRNYLSIGSTGKLGVSDKPNGFQVFSVTYQS